MSWITAVDPPKFNHNETFTLAESHEAAVARCSEALEQANWKIVSDRTMKKGGWLRARGTEKDTPPKKTYSAQLRFVEAPDGGTKVTLKANTPTGGLKGSKERQQAFRQCISELRAAIGIGSPAVESESQPVETQAAESRPAATQAAESQPAATQAAESQPAESQAAESQAAEGQAAESQAGKSEAEPTGWRARLRRSRD